MLSIIDNVRDNVRDNVIDKGEVHHHEDNVSRAGPAGRCVNFTQGA